MDVSKLKLQYVTRIINSTAFADVVKLQALQTMMDANSYNQDLVEELAMLKAPLDNQQLTEQAAATASPHITGISDDRGEGGGEGVLSASTEREPVSPSSATPSIKSASMAPASLAPASVAPNSLASQIDPARAGTNKDSGDLIEEIRITAETMKSSFLRMKDHMANDDAIFEKAKEAQLKNEDGTKIANTSTSAFVAATRVGMIEMLIQICVAVILGLAALYFV